MQLLLLAPHCDDEMAGLPLYFFLQRKGNVELKILSFSICEETAQSLNIPKDAIAKEKQVALHSVGIPLESIQTFQFPVRRFSEHRQEILEELIKVRTDFNPDIVLGPGASDVHQDHWVVHNEMLRCFKNDTTILGWAYLWNIFREKNNVFFELDETMIKKLVTFCSCFKSQKHKLYMQEDFIRASFTTTGIKIGKPFAVGYQCIRFRGVL
jgi:LmbE family N-acetylglucosaminyl deacetylase